MKTIINIGTDEGNITGVKFNKPFRDITYSDIKKEVKKKYGRLVRVQGWANVTPEENE